MVPVATIRVSRLPDRASHLRYCFRSLQRAPMRPNPERTKPSPMTKPPLKVFETKPVSLLARRPQETFLFVLIILSATKTDCNYLFFNILRYERYHTTARVSQTLQYHRQKPKCVPCPAAWPSGHPNSPRKCMCITWALYQRLSKGVGEEPR